MTMASMADGSKYWFNDNIVSLYNDLNFENVDSNYPDPEYNSIGYTIGKRTLKYGNDTTTLIAVTIRSGGYGIEWGGNFNIGNFNYHYGFNEGALTALQVLRNYISSNNITGKKKIWICGYSRGAAVANLLAAKLDDGSINGITNKDVYAYCFECPRNTFAYNAHNAKYNNIFSIVNPIDLVTQVAPAYFGYTTYGKVLTLPASVNTGSKYQQYYKQQMLRKYAEILGYAYWDKDGNYRINFDSRTNEYAWQLTPEVNGQSSKLTSIISYISKTVGSVEKYVNKYQTKVMDAAAQALGRNEKVDLKKFWKEILGILIKAEWNEVVDVVSGKACYTIKNCKDDAAVLFEDHNNLSRQKSKAFLSHYPELCLSWMEAMKSNPSWGHNIQSVSLNDNAYVFDDDEIPEDEEYEVTEAFFAPSTNRLIWVDQSVDVDIYDEETSELIAQVINGETTEIEYGLYSYIDVDGQRVFVVPDDYECRVEIRPTEDGNITYTCIEQNYVNNETNKIVSYVELEAQEGDSFTGTVENIYNEETTASYELVKEGETLTPTYELEGDEIEQYTIELDIQGDGVAFGGGNYIPGEYAQIEVIDGNDHFLGFFDEEDSLISQDSVYRFLPDSSSGITAVFDVYVYCESLSLSDHELTLAEGDAYKIETSIYPEEASRENLYYSSDDESIAYVEQDGTIIAVSEGKTYITVATKYGFESSDVCEVTVKTSKELYGDILPEDRPADPSDIPESLWYSPNASESEYYTGKAIKKSFRVYDHKTLLKEGKDYTVKYSNNTKVSTETSKATITITGKGNYTKKETITFDILRKPLGDDDVSLTIPNLKYSGKVQYSKPILKFNGKTLKLNTDYTLEYNEDYEGAYRDVGSYTFIIDGIGNYQGHMVCQFTITDDTAWDISKMTLTKPKNITYTGEPIDPDTFDVVLKDPKTKQQLVKGIHYLLSLSEDTVNVGTVTVNIWGIQSCYGSRKAAFKIMGIPMSKTKVSNLTSSFIYDGQQKLQESLVVTYQKDKKSEVKTLTPGEDYELSYVNNVRAGTATVTLTGKGLYTGTTKKTFKITPYDMVTDTDHKISVSYVDTVSYSKGGAKPEVEVSYNGEVLTEGTDYTLTYKNNTSVNDGSNPKKMPSFTIKGKGNFKGSITGNTFTITPRSFDDMTVVMTASDKVFSTKKNGWKSAPTLKDGGKKLVSGTDYDKSNIVYTYLSETVINNGTVIREADEPVQPTDVIPAGTYIKVTVSGKKNYQGELDCLYRITQYDISKANITVKAKSYTGRPVTLDPEDVTVKIGKTVIDPENYQIDETTYRNNVSKGKASVTIRGINNLGSSKTVNFSIGAKIFQWWWNLWQ